MIHADFEVPMHGFTRCGRDWSSPGEVYADYHRYYFLVGGSAWVESRGERVELRSGRAWVIPGGRRVAYGCDKPFEVYWFHLRGLPVDVNACLSRLPAAVPLAAAWSKSSRPRWAELATPLGAMSAAGRLRVLALAASAAAASLERVPVGAEESPGDGRDLQRLAPVIAYMDRHFRENPPLGELADRAHLSPIYFHRLFTRAMGCTPHDYLLARRMRLARRLLHQGDDPVSAVAAESGYDNAFYFSRAFRRYFGVSPRRMRDGRAIEGP